MSFPRFSSIFLVIFCVATLLFTLFFSSSSWNAVLIFIFLIFWDVTFAFSLAFYFIFKKRFRYADAIKSLGHKSLRWGAFFSFGVSFILGLKAFNVLNVINLIIFLVMYLTIYFQLKKYAH